MCVKAKLGVSEAELPVLAIYYSRNSVPSPWKRIKNRKHSYG